jgi:hypothetical protein
MRTPGGTRTLDPKIKSFLPLPLSYRRMSGAGLGFRMMFPPSRLVGPGFDRRARIEARSVSSSGFEPETFAMSGRRSNQLSYKDVMYRMKDSNLRATPCDGGALAAELIRLYRLGAENTPLARRSFRQIMDS